VADIVIVDGSRVTRSLVRKVLADHAAKPTVREFDTAAEARAFLTLQEVDLVITALRLPDEDGVDFARSLREAGTSRYMPVIAVSGDVTRRLHTQGGLDGVTDYFDKRDGFTALCDFVSGYLEQPGSLSGRILLVEDSKVVALAMSRMLKEKGLDVEHATSATGALEILGLDASHANANWSDTDVVVTDNLLENGETGGDLLHHLRIVEGISQAKLPALVVTGDDNLEHRATLLRAGANDLIGKPVEAANLLAKLRYQLRVAKHHRTLQRVATEDS